MATADDQALGRLIERDARHPVVGQARRSAGPRHRTPSRRSRRPRRPSSARASRRRVTKPSCSSGALSPIWPTPTKVTSACRARSITLLHRLLHQEQRLLVHGRGDDRQRHRIVRRLHRVGDADDDVVERGRAVGRDVADQRDDLVLRAFHRRQLLDRGAQRAARCPWRRRSDAARSSRRSSSAAVASATPTVVDGEAGSDGTTSHSCSPCLAISRCDRSRQLAIGWSSRTLISAR